MNRKLITISIDLPNADYHEPNAWYVRDDALCAPFESMPYATEEAARKEAEARQAYFLVHGWAVQIEAY